MELQQKFDTTTKNAMNFREELFIAAENVIASRVKLETAKYELLRSGKIDGKNAEIREAQTAEALTAEYKELHDAEAKERLAKMNFDIAMFELDNAKYSLRIAELAKA